MNIDVPDLVLEQYRLRELPPADALTAEIAAVDRDEVRRWPVDDAPAGTPGAARAVTVPWLRT